MPPTPPPHTITQIPPPSPSLLPLARQLCCPPSPSPSPTITSTTTSLPAPFASAILIRKAVFVDEQGCSAAEEVDDDDARSWHWVLYTPALTSPLPAPPLPVPTPSHTTSPPTHPSHSTSPPAPISPPTHPSPAPTIPPTHPSATIRLVPVHGTHGGDAHWSVRPGWGLPDYGGSSTWDGVEGYVKIGRLATVVGARGHGLGRVLVEEVVRWAGRNGGVVGRRVGVEVWGGGGAGGDEGEGEGGWKGLIGCHAQKHLEGWYGKLGFVRDEGMGEWEEDGIPHVGMWRRVEV